MAQTAGLRVAFLGATNFSQEMLAALLDQRVDIRLVLTIPENFRISYSQTPIRNYNYADLGQLARAYGIPCREVDSQSGQRLADQAAAIAATEPDLLLVLGWYYLVPRSIRDLARLGAWGIHASLLPDYAGGAPLVWAIINGETEAGVTLFRLADGVDDGDIIAQSRFPIAREDTIAQVYAQATESAKRLLLQAVLHPEQVRFTPQKTEGRRVFPQRRPEDGRIDVSRSAREIYDFIRAQTHPYPGAFGLLNGRKLTLWKTDLPRSPSRLERSPGELYSESGQGLLCLRDGVLPLRAATFGDDTGEFATLAERHGLWGCRLDS